MPYDPNWPDTTTKFADSGGGSVGLSSTSFSLLGGAAADIFGGFADLDKSKGNEIEASNYRQASEFATYEAKVQNATTAVQEAQTQRQVYQGLGKVAASIGGSGFSDSGSGGDILRSSAQQGALQSAIAEQTGQVAEAGYKEQAKSYESMAEASDMAAHAQKMAAYGSFASGGLKLVGAAML